MPESIDNLPVHDSRLRQLIQLGLDGSDEALADLWHEFNVDLGEQRE
jgi:hypothetical protein